MYKEQEMNLKRDLHKKHRGVKRLLAMTLGLVMAISTCVFALPQTRMSVKAAGTGKNLQIGSAVLTPIMTSVEDTTYNPSNTKDRVTTAQTVDYGNNDNKKWYVIGYNGTGAVGMSNTVTLFAEDNLVTGKAYHNPSNSADRSNHYGTSDIKSVVEGYYGTLFTNEEKGIILKRTLVTGGYNSDYDLFSDGIADDSAVDADLWLLSTKEADLLERDEYRYVSGGWWLRSPGFFDDYAAYVYGDGVVYYFGDFVHYDAYGVRPAFNLNLQSIIFTSAAAGGKSSGAVGADALTSVADSGSNTEWKLTIADSTRNGFSASRTDSDELTAGGTAEISYSGAKIGTGEYVSAIITDSSDTVLYYGHIAEGAASGSASINIPTGASAGCKLYVFQEKCNVDCKTDYSSGLINLTAPGSSGSGATVISTPGAQQDVIGEETVDDIPEPDYLDALMKMLEEAKEAGGPQTIYWSEGTALPGPAMKFLSENPQITLVFSYTYQGLDYTVTLPGKNVKYDPNVPWCGPLYLYGLYGRYSASTPVKTTNSTLTLGNRTYTITSGDSLWDIARRLGITVDELVRINNVKNPDKIDIGQIIRY